MQSTRVKVQAGLVTVVAGLAAVGATTGSWVSAQATYQYELAENWAQIPEGAKWGTMTAVDVDAEGTVYALQRGEPAKIGLRLPGQVPAVVGRGAVRSRRTACVWIVRATSG